MSAQVGHSAVHGTKPSDIAIKRVLISVYDKTGIVEFVQSLSAFNVEIISTGGTAVTLRKAGFTVIDASEVTHSPEMLHGRVKTLHPLIHGGLLAVRGNADDEADVIAHSIPLIDMVVVNLYPFSEVVANPAVTLAQAVENIDIGGPSMIRSASKNHNYVAVITNTSQYSAITAELQANNGSLTFASRFKLAAAAFKTTAEYDTAIAAYLATQTVQ